MARALQFSETRLLCLRNGSNDSYLAWWLYVACIQSVARRSAHPITTRLSSTLPSAPRQEWTGLSSIRLARGGCPCRRCNLILSVGKGQVRAGALHLGLINEAAEGLRGAAALVHASFQHQIRQLSVFSLGEEGGSGQLGKTETHLF